MRQSKLRFPSLGPPSHHLEGRQEQDENQSWGVYGSHRASLLLLPSSLCLRASFLSCQSSPAAAILELFEEQNGSLQELHYLMTLMERLDCASAIQSYMGSPAPIRMGAWKNHGLELDVKL